MPFETNVVGVKEPRLACFERPLIYNPSDSESLVELHQSIARTYGCETPYFDFTDKDQELLFSHRQNHVTIKVGPIGAFSTQEIARMIQEQTTVYVLQGTMGDFPVDDSEKTQELVGIMLDGYDPNRIVVLYEYEDTQGVKPITGVQAFFGKADTQIKDSLFAPSLFNHQDTPSTLSTLQALRVRHPGLSSQHSPTINPQNLGEFLHDYGHVSENQIACMSRLFRQTRDTLQKLNIDNRDLAWEAMAWLALGIQTHAERTQEIHIPVITLYDTHTDKIQGKLSELFAMKLISQNGSLMATPEVMGTVLRHHYDKAENGGHIDDILIGFADMRTYHDMAKAFLDSKGYPTTPTTRTQKPHFQVSLLGPKIMGKLQLQESEKPPLNPELLKPTVLDAREPDDLLKLQQIAENLSPQHITQRPYLVGAQETLDLAEHEPHVSIEALTQVVIDKLLPNVSEVTEEELRDLLKANPLLEDYHWLSQQAHTLANTLEDDARWVWNPMEQRLALMIGPNAWRLHMRSRLLGLIPYETLDKFQKTPIISMGCSAVAELIDTCVAYGAENVKWWDGGIIDPSNLPRFPAGMGHYLNLGYPKALALQAIAYGRNPYGRFTGSPGKIQPNAELCTSPCDITFEDAVRLVNDGFLLEVIDAPKLKVLVRDYLQTNSPATPTVFLADTAHQPFVGIEIPGKQKHFNRDITHAQLQEMSLSTNPLRDVMQMLGTQNPSELQLQLVLVALGQIRFWSQPPGASRESAAIGAKTMLAYLQGQPVSGENYTSSSVISSLVPHLTPPQYDTLGKITTSIFKL